MSNQAPFSVTKDGKVFTDYYWDEKTKTFSTNENNLVIDASNHDNCNFITGSDCTFKTGYSCTFNTCSECTFKTGPYCTFKTGIDCNFDTGYNCTFDTGSDCTFNTGSDCTFDTGSYCTFNTGSDCTFNTGSDCTFTVKENCVIVRRDKFGVIQPEPNQTTILTKDGFEVVKPNKTITIDGKDIVISEESYNELKNQLTE